MKSRNLFFKLMKEDLKRRIWTIALSMLLLFLILPILSALTFENYIPDSLKEYQLDSLLRFIGPGNEALMVITIIGAVITGLSGFFYLHSRKKVDLFHSIPVSRETLFAASYINGLIIYLVPYLINLVLSMIILNNNHLMNMKMLTAARDGFFIHILFYCMIYTTAIIATMLTGNIIVSCLGTLVFLLYGPILVVIKQLYLSSFFVTYYSGMERISKISYLSPLGSYIRIVGQYYEKHKYTGSFMICFLITIILIAIALFLYKKRPSQASGNAMAFGLSKPIICFLLVIPLTLGGGIFFRNIGSMHQEAWYIFGLIFCFIIIFAIIQVIFNFDIRSVFHNKIQMVICFVVTAVVACVFRFDLFHYDTYQPAKDKIESMSVYFSGVDDNINNMVYDKIDRNYINKDYYQLENMKLTDFNEAYLLARTGIDNNAEFKMNKVIRGRTLYNGFRYQKATNMQYFTYTVKYHLKSGKKVYRMYSIPIEYSNKLVDIYADKNFKEAHFPIYQWKEEEVKQIYISYGLELFNYEEFGDSNGRKFFDDIDTKDLMRVFKEELYNLSLKEIANSYPIAKLTFDVYDHDNAQYYVYPSFTKTLKYLEEHGFDTLKTMKPESVTDISVTNLNENHEYNYTKEEIASEPSDDSITYKEKKEIEALLPVIIQSDYYECNDTIIGAEDFIRVMVNYKIGNKDNSNSMSYYFLKNQIPDFVKKDLNIK